MYSIGQVKRVKHTHTHYTLYQLSLTLISMYKSYKPHTHTTMYKLYQHTDAHTNRCVRMIPTSHKDTLTHTLMHTHLN